MCAAVLISGPKSLPRKLHAVILLASPQARLHQLYIFQVGYDDSYDDGGSGIGGGRGHFSALVLDWLALLCLVCSTAVPLYIDSKDRSCAGFDRFDR